MKEFRTDQKMQQFSQLFNISKPQLYCQSNNIVTHLCINPSCAFNSPLCQIQDCHSCKNHQENGCSIIMLRSITGLLQKISQNKSSLLHHIIKIEERMIEAIQFHKRKFKNKFELANFVKDQMEILESIYSNRSKHAKIRSSDSYKLTEKIKRNKNETNQKEEELINYFKNQIQKVTQKILHLESQVMENLFTQTIKLDSRIILPMNVDDLKFIKQALKQPTKLQLLFRASDNNFSVSQFHKKCDNIEHTFVLIKTEFGKVIAGYTPLKWQAQKSNYINDPRKQSFILSVTLKQKFILSKNQFAIYSRQDCGPIFGGGFDIQISDKCNLNSNSYSNIGHSYTNPTYPQNQETFTAFSGSSVNYMYKVEEYQVFKLIW